MAIQDLLKSFGQRLGSGLTQVGGYDPMQQVSPEEAARRRLEGLSTLQRGLGRSAAILSGDPRRIQLAEQQIQQAEQQKKLEDEIGKLDPSLQSIYRLFGPDITAEVMFPEEPKTGSAKVGSLWKDQKSGIQFRELIIGDQIFFQSPSTGETYSLNEMKEEYPDARPSTAGEATKYYQSIGEVRKESANLLTNEQSIDRLNNYLDQLQKTPIGIERLYNDFTAAIKTIAGDSDLSDQQVAQKIARGNLQGLVGSNRLEIAGPGVLTEQDWQRILEAVGGDVTMLQNPSVTFPLINKVLEQKIETFNEKAQFYNYAIDSGLYGTAFQKRDIKEFKPRTYLPEGVPEGSRLIGVDGNDLYYSTPDNKIKKFTQE